MIRLFRTKRSARRALLKVLNDTPPPSFPQLAMEVLKQLREPSPSMGKIGRLISADPGMSVTMLKAINCAAYGLRRRVDSTSHAVNLLGQRRVEGLVLSLAVSEVLPTGDPKENRLFWQTAAERATLARRISRLIAPESTDLAFTAALLQDMSLPLLRHHRPRQYQPLMDAWNNRDIELHEEEQRRFGWTHAEVARWLGEEWGFGEELLQAIGSHHDEASGLQAVNLVGLLRAPDDQEGIEQLIATLTDSTSFTPEQILTLIEQSAEESKELGVLLAA